MENIYCPMIAKDTTRRITGYAILFNSMSAMLCDRGESFYEIIEPQAITKQMLDSCDIKLTMFHDRQIILARSNKGVGTLQYAIDGKGVQFWAIMPNTPQGDYALEAVRRGDISGCSFQFYISDDKEHCYYTYDANDIPVRHITKIDVVTDMTLAASPAYPKTTVANREWKNNNGKAAFFSKCAPKASNVMGDRERNIIQAKRKVEIAKLRAAAMGKETTPALEEAQRDLTEAYKTKEQKIAELKQFANSILK